MNSFDSKIFNTYANVTKMLTSSGYTCSNHLTLLEFVKAGDGTGFINYLKEKFDNYTIINICREPNKITIWEKLISIWKHSDDKIKKDAVLYFSNYSEGPNLKVSKEEASRAIEYLTLLQKTSLIFVHINCMSTMCQKHLKSVEILTSDRYTVNIVYTPFLNIRPWENFWVPKHTLIRYSPEFYENEGLTRGRLPKIHQNDPGISQLGASVGDIIKIERLEEFDGMSTIMFREVIKPSVEFNVNSKNK